MPEELFRPTGVEEMTQKVADELAGGSTDQEKRSKIEDEVMDMVIDCHEVGMTDEAIIEMLAEALAPRDMIRRNELLRSVLAGDTKPKIIGASHPSQHNLVEN